MVAGLIAAVVLALGLVVLVVALIRRRGTPDPAYAPPPLPVGSAR